MFFRLILTDRDGLESDREFLARLAFNGVIATVSRL